MYELIYNTIDGKVSGIRRLSDMACIPLTIWNNDYVAFLAWNDHQATPLDLNSTIPVVPPIPTRDLAKEIDKLGGVVNTDVDMITIRAQWKTATTQVQKLAVITKVLKLE